MKTAQIVAISMLLLAARVLGQCQLTRSGQCDDPNRRCESRNGVCTRKVDFLTDQISCDCVGRCRYDKETRSCVDFGGVCSKGTCCTFALAQFGKDGEPVCRCSKRDDTFGAPCSECEWNKNQRTCIDRHQICEDKFKGCCSNWELTGPNKEQWDICICQKNQPHECATCAYDKDKAACIDPTGRCSPKNGNCCQRAQGFSVMTGLPKCECVASKYCPQCEREAPGLKCFDKTGVCRDPNCCGIDVIGNVDYCHCHSCWNPPKKCYYDPFRKICRNTGLCPNGNCCEAVGVDARGHSICECKEKRSDQLPCSTCQWRNRRCQDPLGKCKGDKCCEMVNKSCQCQRCEPPSSCKYDRQLGSCVDANRQCQSLTGHCCKITAISTLGIPICKCSNTGQEKCDQCQKSADGTCRDPNQICTGDKCCKEIRLPISRLSYCECQGCPNPCPKCLVDPDIRTCRNLDCPEGFCCTPSRTTAGIRCDCKPKQCQVCETCHFDRTINRCVDRGDTCKPPKVCKKYNYLRKSYCFCLGPILQDIEPVPLDPSPFSPTVQPVGEDIVGNIKKTRKAKNENGP